MRLRRHVCDEAAKQGVYSLPWVGSAAALLGWLASIASRSGGRQAPRCTPSKIHSVSQCTV